MANFRINPNEKTKRVNISLPPSVIDMLDEMTVLGHRSELIRECIVTVYAGFQVRKAKQSAKETK